MNFLEKIKNNKEDSIISIIIVISLLLLITNKISRVVNFIWIFLGIYYIIKNKGFKKTGIEKYVCIYFLSQGISLIWAVNFQESGHEYYRHLYGIIPIFTITQIPFLKKISLKCFDFIFGIVTIYYFIYVNLQYLNIVKKVFNSNRVVGFTDGSIVKYAYVIGVILIYYFYKILIKEKSKFDILLFLMNVYLLLLSQARGAWLGVVSSLIVMYIIYNNNNIKKSIKNILKIIGIIGIGIYLLKKNKLILLFLKRFESIGNIKTDMSNVARIEMWKDAILKFKETKGLGLGYKNNLGYMTSVGKYDHAHSDYFYILSSTGVLGILGYFYFLIGIFMTCLKYRKENLNFYILGVVVFLSVYGLVEVLIQTSITLTLSMFIISFYRKNTEG